MARLITKFKYLKPSARQSVGGYAKYIATREGVEKVDNTFKNDPSTEKQKKLIEKILQDFPDSKSMLEYEDYLKEPTLGNASEFITRALEDNAVEVMECKTYADYIATRPRAQRFGSHGLFTDDGIRVKLGSVSQELKEGGEIIVDNTQITLFGGFAPNSSSADTLSKALGSRTVMSGSVSRSKSDPSESLQMMERPLLTPDELKSLPKGDFVVMKTGVHPMRVHLKLFFKWGIEFDKDHPYTVAENGNRKVQYANKAELMDGIIRKYHPEALLEGDITGEGGGMAEPEQTEAKNHQPLKSNRSRSRLPKPLPEKTERDGKKGGSHPSQKQAVAEADQEPVLQEVNPDGQT